MIGSKIEAINTHVDSDSLHGAPDAEATAFAERIERHVRRCGRATIARGGGRDESPAGETTAPRCHILAFKVEVPPVYAKWARPRVDSYRSLGTVIEAETTYYLHMSDEMWLE